VLRMAVRLVSPLSAHEGAFGGGPGAAAQFGSLVSRDGVDGVGSSLFKPRAKSLQRKNAMEPNKLRIMSQRATELAQLL